MTRILLALIVLGATLACTVETSQSAPTAINANCPGMGNPVDVSVPTYDWNGKTIGFCCDGCPEKFAKLSDAEKAAALAKVGTQIDG